MVERAVREVEAQVKCMLLALQARVGRNVSSKLAVVYWMVDHAGELINRFARGDDGKTARENEVRTCRLHGPCRVRRMRVLPTTDP